MSLGWLGAGHLCQAVSGVRMSISVQRGVPRVVQHNRETTYGPVELLIAPMSVFLALMAFPG